jgi:hypothetical protein
MFLGFWKVNGEGEATLEAENTKDAYARIGTFRTVSVRLVTGPLGPGGTRRVACGLVVQEDSAEI